MRKSLIVLGVIALIVLVAGALNNDVVFSVDYVAGTAHAVSLFWMSVVVAVLILVAGLAAVWFALSGAAGGRRKLETELQSTYERLRESEKQTVEARTKLRAAEEKEAAAKEREIAAREAEARAAEEQAQAAASAEATAVAEPEEQTVVSEPEQQTAVVDAEGATVVAEPEDETVVAGPEAATVVAEPETETLVEQPPAEEAGDQTAVTMAPVAEEAPAGDAPADETTDAAEPVEPGQPKP